MHMRLASDSLVDINAATKASVALTVGLDTWAVDADLTTGTPLSASTIPACLEQLFLLQEDTEQLRDQCQSQPQRDAAVIRGMWREALATIEESVEFRQSVSVFFF